VVSVSDRLHYHIEKNGIIAVTLFFTLLSVVVSLVVTYLFHILLNIADPTLGLILAAACSLLVAPPMSFIILKLADQLRRTNLELSSAREELKTLSSLLPMCAWCKEIRDDQGYWNTLESYLAEHMNTEVTHSICPTCRDKLQAELVSQ